MQTRTLYVRHEVGVDEFYFDAVIVGIRLALALTGIQNLNVEIRRPFNINSEIINLSRRETGKLDASKLISNIACRLKSISPEPFCVFVFKEKIFWYDNGEEIDCFGFAHAGVTALIRVSEFPITALTIEEKFDFIVRLTLHEVGHLFGMTVGNRKVDVKDLHGWHCTNSRCVMSSGGSYRLNIDMKKPYCAACLHNIIYPSEI